MEAIVTFLFAAGLAMFFLSSPTAPRNIYQAIVLCAIVLGFQKLVTALFSGRCVEDFIPIQQQIEVLVEQSPSRKPQVDAPELLAPNWRSMQNPLVRTAAQRHIAIVDNKWIDIPKKLYTRKYISSILINMLLWDRWQGDAYKVYKQRTIRYLYDAKNIAF